MFTGILGIIVAVIAIILCLVAAFRWMKPYSIGFRNIFLIFTAFWVVILIQNIITILK